MTSNRKEIAQKLDRAAARAGMIDATPATSKQCWYLAGLLAEAGLDADMVGCELTNTSAVLTCRAASGFIDMLLRDRSAKAA